MAKQKPSASSATRKKHARKAAGEPAEPPPSKPGKGKGKGKDKAEPRKKAYVPPSKPAPVRPDPLDSKALAAALPPDLIVVLKGLGKKAAATKARALEDLQREWLQPRDEDATTVLSDAVPVWVRCPSTQQTDVI
jgi:hypothetical protein